MVTRVAPPEKSRSAKGGTARCATPIGAILAFTVLALGFSGPIARADSLDDWRQQRAAGVQRDAQLPPPVRVILPAPWEQAAPVPAAAPTESADPVQSGCKATQLATCKLWRSDRPRGGTQDFGPELSRPIGAGARRDDDNLIAMVRAPPPSAADSGTCFLCKRQLKPLGRPPDVCRFLGAVPTSLALAIRSPRS
jgi:hypothetical protein